MSERIGVSDAFSISGHHIFATPFPATPFISGLRRKEKKTRDYISLDHPKPPNRLSLSAALLSGSLPPSTPQSSISLQSNFAQNHFGISIERRVLIKADISCTREKNEHWVNFSILSKTCWHLDELVKKSFQMASVLARKRITRLPKKTNFEWEGQKVKVLWEVVKQMSTMK
ncbi:hypothetical protein LguiA_018650 [Lonicera macranthoides]